MNILDYYKTLTKYKNIVHSINSLKECENIYIGNAASNASKILAALSYLEKNESIIYVCESIYEATKSYEVFCDLVGTDRVSFFPVEEFISSNLVASSMTFRLARMLTLYNIENEEPKIIVTDTEGITRRMMSMERIKKSIIEIKKGNIYNMKQLVVDLVNRGYKKVALTEEMGTFSVRGSIIDIFPINEENVYRLNFFDDEVETIKKVNIETQMSAGHLDQILIFPLFDLFYTEDEFNSFEKEIKSSSFYDESMDEDLNNLRNYNSLDQLYIYLPYIDKENTTLTNLLKNPLVFYENINGIISHEENAIIEISEYFGKIKFRGIKNYFLSVKEMFAEAKGNIFLNQYIASLNDVKLSKLIDLKTLNCYEYNNNLRSLIEDVKATPDKTYIINHFDSNKLEFIRESFETAEVSTYLVEDFHDLKKNEVNLIVSNNNYGFKDLELNIEFLSPNEFSPGKITKGTKYAKYYKNSTKVYDKDELTVGDYVIHQDYGVGRYLGIKTVELRGNQNDYLAIQYAEDGKLLVPVANLYLIEKYNISSDALPKLNSLSGKEWKKKKEQVRHKVVDVARRLVAIQAERDTKEGFMYKKDTQDQLKFESDFTFNETTDQLEAIQAVKKDMESTRPVDRLICGDVGFGKTEVAMRAAFKAIENGKQVAYLAPTTVLTRQHYYTFKERFEKYGVRVELLNRFVPISMQKKIIEGLKEGYVDIIIGTHRLLGKDIAFKDLGLLIVDEEQRFGVIHKERIKELKANVDVLTLTATPIPRTLQLSLSGLRDLSLIQTPPMNRLPVQTFVLESNDSVIREAINRELGRGGQVFYLINRVELLDKISDKIRKLVPHAQIGIIHGQMDKDDIENTLIKFLEKTYNVLVCTTIIETGIDIPNANTLIIEKADILGLSQLYQIRGRVGRSDRISYAYLMYDHDKIITETAMKRLEAIKEFTELGSGYKIAMRDLAIRGAGDILGAEQSGFIDAIGMELYMKLLQEAISEIKGVKKEEHSEKTYNISVSKHIDTSYVSDDEIRIMMHQEIGKIRSRDQIDMLKVEYTDRYGKLSEQILLYMEERYLEFLLKSHGVEQLKETKEEVYIIFDKEATTKIDFRSAAKVAKEVAPLFYFTLQDYKLKISINPTEYEKSYIYTLTKFLERI